MSKSKTMKTAPQSNILPFLTAILFGVAALLVIFIFVSLNSQGDTTTPTVDIENATPTVANVQISTSSYGNQESSLNLTEATTTEFYVHGMITDNNGCVDVATSGSAKIYFYDTQYTFCLSDFADDARCYIGDMNDANCSFGSATGTYENPCNGGTDTNVSFQCQFDVHHFADATGAGGTFEAFDWEGRLVATDGAAFTSSSSATSTIEVLTAIDVGSTINYGALNLSATSSDIGLVVRNTGNEQIDVNISGTSMPCSEIGTINVAQQKYSLTSSIAYSSKTALSGTPTLVEFNLNRQTTAATLSTTTLYNQIQLPSEGVAGTCTGTTTLTALQSL